MRKIAEPSDVPRTRGTSVLARPHTNRARWQARGRLSARRWSTLWHQWGGDLPAGEVEQVALSTGHEPTPYATPMIDETSRSALLGAAAAVLRGLLLR